MNNLHKLAFAATAAGVALFAGASANAQLLSGSLPLAGLVVSENGPNLFLSTTVTAAKAFTSGAGIHDYSPIPLFTLFNTTPLVLANPTTFSISNPTWGSFHATSDTIVSHTPFFYEAVVLGVFTPGPGLPGKLPTAGELRISINRSGKSLSEAITLDTPPLAIPEPGNVATLVGMGLSGAGFLLRKRLRK